MIILEQLPASNDANGAPVAPATPLNGVWLGLLRRRLALPRAGHVLLVLPLDGCTFSCGDVTVTGNRYLFSESAGDRPVFLTPAHVSSRLLLLFLSPGFIHEMADFAGIDSRTEALLHDTPLLRGDATSSLLAELGDAISTFAPPSATEELFLELVGHILRLLRQRQDGLLRLDRHRKRTIDDLLPRLQQARQFIEARYLSSIAVGDVADHVALSEYHLARLFRTAFDVTIHQYVMQLRLDDARRRLEHSVDSVTDIAPAVGYQSLSSFIHAFRRRYGVPPGQYRRLLVESDS